MHYKNLSPFVIGWIFLGQPLIVLFALICVLPIYVTVISGHNHPLHEMAIMTVGAIFIMGVIISISRLFSFPVTILTVGSSLFLWKKVRLEFLLGITPVLGLLLWYGYDHLLPDGGWAGDSEPPYMHGLTWVRFVIAWLVELGLAVAYWIPLRKLQLSSLREAHKSH